MILIFLHCHLNSLLFHQNALDDTEVVEIDFKISKLDKTLENWFLHLSLTPVTHTQLPVSNAQCALHMSFNEDP